MPRKRQKQTMFHGIPIVYAPELDAIAPNTFYFVRPDLVEQEKEFLKRLARLCNCSFGQMFKQA